MVREGIFSDLDTEFREKYGLRKLEVTDKRRLLPAKMSSGKPIMKISKLSFPILASLKSSRTLLSSSSKASVEFSETTVQAKQLWHGLLPD